MSSTYDPNTGQASNTSPKDMAAEAARKVKEEVSTFASTAQEKARSQVDRKKDTATQTLNQFAGAIRRAGDELSQNDQSMAGRVVKQAADGLEGLARSVSDKRPEELLDAVRDFGRRNPVAFVAGALLVGVAAGRFVRSSASHSHRPSGSSTPFNDTADHFGEQPRSAPSFAADPTPADERRLDLEAGIAGEDVALSGPFGQPMQPRSEG